MKNMYYCLMCCAMYTIQGAQIKPLFTKEGMSSQEWRAAEPQIQADARRIKATGKFIVAALNQNIGKMQEALNEGADINAQAERDERTALHIAIDANNVPMIKFLLDHDALLGIEDNAGRSSAYMFNKPELAPSLNVISQAIVASTQRSMAKSQELTRKAFQQAKQKQEEQVHKKITIDQSI